MIKVGIVGGTGYTGVELLRLLAGHPEVNIKIVTSNTYADKPVSSAFPGLAGLLNLTFTESDSAQVEPGAEAG